MPSSHDNGTIVSEDNWDVFSYVSSQSLPIHTRVLYTKIPPADDKSRRRIVLWWMECSSRVVISTSGANAVEISQHWLPIHFCFAYTYYITATEFVTRPLLNRVWQHLNGSYYPRSSPSMSLITNNYSRDCPVYMGKVTIPVQGVFACVLPICTNLSRYARRIYPPPPCFWGYSIWLQFA